MQRFVNTYVATRSDGIQESDLLVIQDVATRFHHGAFEKARHHLKSHPTEVVPHSGAAIEKAHRDQEL